MLESGGSHVVWMRKFRSAFVIEIASELGFGGVKNVGRHDCGNEDVWLR